MIIVVDLACENMALLLQEKSDRLSCWSSRVRLDKCLPQTVFTDFVKFVHTKPFIADSSFHGTEWTTKMEYTKIPSDIKSVKTDRGMFCNRKREGDVCSLSSWKPSAGPTSSRYRLFPPILARKAKSRRQLRPLVKIKWPILIFHD